MNVKIKLAAYAVLVILVIVFGCLFYSNYQAATKAAAAAGDEPSPSPVATAPAAPTNAATNIVAQTNAVNSDTNIAGADTNAAVATNNSTPTTNVAAATPPPVPAKVAPAPDVAPKKHGSWIGYLGAFVVCLIGLGLLIAADVTAYMGARSVDFLFNDDGQAERDPAYEKAEQVWAQGKHLEAIQMMREYLHENPRAQYVAIRIAEIYEKDLKNFIASSLEYEEILKQKLPSDRWGWTAVHLCNLYNKMGQEAKALALLQRVADEHPKTAAAKKARARLGIPEPIDETPATPPPAEEPAPGVEVAYQRTKVNIDPKAKINYADAMPVEETEPEEPQTPPPPRSNLPPGFRPK